MKSIEFGLATDQDDDLYMRYLARIAALVGLTALIVAADTLINYWAFT